MEEWKLKVGEDGDVSAERELSDDERETRLDEILKMIDNPEKHPGEIKRLIAVEIARVNRLMIKYGNDVSILEGLKIKALAEQIKGLRELGKEVQEADIISKKDFLNMDGPKFRLAIDAFREGSKEAMRTAGLDESTINSVLRHWGDIMSAREAEIRKALDKLDSGK